MATRVGVLDRGRVVQVGTPREIYQDPVSTLVATRLGSPTVNLLPRALFPGLAAPPGAATVGVRTDHVRIRRAAGGAAAGRVTRIEHLGDQSRLHVAVADADVVTLVDPDERLVVGDAVDLEMLAPLFFDERGDRVRAA